MNSQRTKMPCSHRGSCVRGGSFGRGQAPSKHANPIRYARRHAGASRFMCTLVTARLASVCVWDMLRPYVRGTERHPEGYG